MKNMNRSISRKIKKLTNVVGRLNPLQIGNYETNYKLNLSNGTVVYVCEKAYGAELDKYDAPKKYKNLDVDDEDSGTICMVSIDEQLYNEYMEETNPKMMIIKERRKVYLLNGNDSNLFENIGLWWPLIDDYVDENDLISVPTQVLKRL